MIRNYKNSLVEPLSVEEFHIFNSTVESDTCISEITGIFKNDVYGIYLLGGLRGSGKTTLMNLSYKLVDSSKYIKITIDCNKVMDLNNFIDIFSFHLLEEVSKREFSQDIREKIMELAKRFYYNDKTVAIKEEKNKKEKVDAIHFQEEKGIQLGINAKYTNIYCKRQDKSQTEDRIFIEETIQLRNELQRNNYQFLMIEDFKKLLKTISYDYGIILVIDELDKQDNKFVVELVNKYKNLLLESRIITFLVVDTISYKVLLSGNELNSVFLSYLTKAIYFPLNDYRDTRNYLYREWEIEEEKEICIAYYETLGIYRKLNIFPYMKRNDLIVPAYIFCFVMEHVETKIRNSCEKDCFKVFVKEVMAGIMTDGGLYKDKIREQVAANNNVYLRWFADKLEEALEDFCKKYSFLVKENGKYVLDDFLCVEHKLKLEYSRKIKLETYSHNINSRGINLGKEYKYIRITKGDPYAYKYLIRFIETLTNKIENIIIVKKIVETPWGEGNKHSALIIANRKIGKVVYCIEDFTFIDEHRRGAEEIYKYLEKNKIKCIEVEIDEEEVEKNINYIVDKVKEVMK